MRLLSLYRIAKYENGTPVEKPITITATLEEILAELDPMEYAKARDEEYKIKYKGYKEDRLKEKLDRKKKNDKSVGKGAKKAADITNFSYVHIFDNEQLDKLIQLIAFSEMLSSEEKSRLIHKLKDTASTYYSTPFFDGDKLKFNPKAVHGRFDTRRPAEINRFSENLKLLQEAVNKMAQVRFCFNRYTSEHEKEPTSEYMHVLSPYHLVVYHDNYYCIGLKNDNKRIWHYRVDLMSDVEIVKDDDGRIVPIKVSSFEGLPICNAAWNPEKYMSEHLYMAYDEPKEIHIKIRDTDYTIIHDWFGDHFEKTNQPCEDGYDIVSVRTSPSMIVPWAMQYAGKVEIMDEAIRKKIYENFLEYLKLVYTIGNIAPVPYRCNLHVTSLDNWEPKLDKFGHKYKAGFEKVFCFDMYKKDENEKRKQWNIDNNDGLSSYLSSRITLIKNRGAKLQMMTKSQNPEY